MKWLASVFRVEELDASGSPQGSSFFLCVCVWWGAAAVSTSENLSAPVPLGSVL